MPETWTHAFEHPEWWAAVWTGLFAAGIGVSLARWTAKKRRRRLGEATIPGLPLARDAALLLALACIGVALLGPRIGTRMIRTTASGVDVVLLFDVSRSMDATDIPPSRLEHSRQAALDLLARLETGDRVALAAFGDRGVLLTPLTPDRDALVELVGALDTSLIEPAGSNLGAGVREAVEAFEAGSERPRIVVVLSDGESPPERRALGMDAAIAADVRVVAVAIGTEAGGRIPNHGLPLRDEQGHIIVSQRNIQRLERLATATDGVVFSADAWGSIDGAELNIAVRRDADNTPGATVERRVRAVRVPPLAALAFGLMLIEALQPLRLRIRRKRSTLRRAALATAIVAFATLGLARPTQNTTLNLLEAQLRHHPGDVRLLIELGLARLERGRQQAAQRAFLAAALGTSDPKLAALAYYNLGVAALERGSYEVARDAFFDVLALRPGDREARFNLEWSLAVLSNETPDPKSSRRLATERKLGAPGRPEEVSETTETGRPSETKTSPQTLDPERRNRWLARIEDDPAAALRSAVRASGRALHRKRIVW